MEQIRGPRREVRIGDTFEIFRDPVTEKQVEGWARVWEVLEEREDLFVLLVSFLGDKTGRRVTREYRAYEGSD